MSDDKTYNGWSNYETWNVALWIDNEEGPNHYWREVTQTCWNEATADKTFTRQERARFTLADRLQQEITNSAPDLGATMWSDLLSAALSEVDWGEIASNWLSDIDGYDESA